MIDPQDIIDIVRERPGSTGLDIHDELVRRSRAGQRFGADSFITMIFGPSLGGTYIALCTLEEAGTLQSQWGKARESRRRLRHYYLSRAYTEAP